LLVAGLDQEQKDKGVQCGDRADLQSEASAAQVKRVDRYNDADSNRWQVYQSLPVRHQICIETRANACRPVHRLTHPSKQRKTSERWQKFTGKEERLERDKHIWQHGLP